MVKLDLKASIQKFALEEGFSRVHFTAPHQIPADRLNSWLRSKFHGQMTYLERNREKRLSPERVLPDVKSIAVFQWPYTGNYSLPYKNSKLGIVSRYASGRDYHNLIQKNLRKLLRKVQKEFRSLEGKCYVDTGPILEKYWAEEAGIGWIGKHTNLIDKNRGSWFFLAVMLLNQEIAPDSRALNHCGTCSRCIDACPTSAILEPYVLDSRKCISYLTIELREDIPIDFRKGMSNLIYGCDICQDVCPWNKKYSSSEPIRKTPSDVVYELEKIAYLGEDDFDEKFRGRAIRRAKWRGLMRNLCIAMGNSRLESFVDPLNHLLHCSDPLVRRHAAWGLSKIGNRRAKNSLRERHAIEKDPFNQRNFARILEQFEN